MAKRASRRRDSEPEETLQNANPREAAIDALLGLLAEHGWSDIGLGDIAAAAGLSLIGLRAEFRSKVAVLAASFERIDRLVLEGGPAEGEGERDRLFDVLMRRFDVMNAYRPALRSLTRSALREPGLALALAAISDRSMTWMLAAAHNPERGLMAKIARRGAGLVYVEAMRVWLRENGTANEKTMAVLDNALRRGERVMGTIRDACDTLGMFGRRARDMVRGDRAAG